MYPDKLKEFVNSCSKSGLTSRTGLPNKRGVQFLDLLRLYDVKFENEDLLTLKDKYWLISHNIGEHRCKFCNKLITGNLLVNKRPYCSTECYKKCPKAKQLISDIKTNLYKDPIFREETNNKRIQTSLSNYGVFHPMQSVEVFERHEKSSRQAYSYRGLNGLRGYEKYIVDWLMDDIGLIPNKHFIGGSAAKKNLEQTIYVNQGHRFPDLYSIPWNTYIEVKSEYTLSKFSNFESLYEYIEDIGSDYICLLYNMKEKSIMQVEPYTRKIIQIESCYLNYIKE